MNLFFLAAGLGTRLRPITNIEPKPCVPFLNVPMGFYQFRFLQNLNITSCTVNSHHLPEKIEELYRNCPYYNKTISISYESTILGSAGALKKAQSLFSDDNTILMMNADEIFFTENQSFLQQAYQQHIRNKNLATLVTMKHAEAGKKFGAIWCDKKRVCNIGKTNTDSIFQPWHYIGIIFLDKRILSFIPENQETNIFYDVLIHQLTQEKVEIFELDCHWFETGNWPDYWAATKYALENLDQKTLDFINAYDSSQLIKSSSGLSLVSNKIDSKSLQLSGYNVIAQTVDAQKVQHLKDSVAFNSNILNASYFT